MAGEGNLPDVWSVSDVERLAAARLAPQVRDYIAGGSGEEVTVAANRAALDRVAVVPRALVDVSACDTGCELFGARSSLPVAVAPMAYQKLIHPGGERAAARAAGSAGVPYVISTLSSEPIDAVAGAAGATWFQLYWLRDRRTVVDLLRRAEDAGCRAVVLTVDVPLLGRRLRDLRNGFALPPGIRPVNVDGDVGEHVPGDSVLARHTAAVFDPSLSWRDLDWLREHTSLPVVLKGVLDAEDADQAVDRGVDGIVVSNHGGRQLDGAVPAVTALPEVVAAVDGRCPVLLDSGVRTGADVLRALALGATAVLVGRPVLWGLGAGGERGVATVLDLLREELETALRLAGCPDLASARRLRTRG
ncbi:alpha-hydroxy acid oxidase [Saccharothrix syringae]|uniref:Alpha-hydroxy-acid oxidizing protein n=1 Tax=Saccharothrix syringae TaxID=103733 RepID=A0A5Q0H5P0_SACSY|nr:alpha-hydroxy acid oxidase [Saccharothrix syringae]QFZ21215.1 alpha-hydroxy-acid oxidizing protein [Saccharothrix syringae]